LDRVSTTCDSGWVRSPQASRQNVRSVDLTKSVSSHLQLRTHPLPQVVLTSTKLNYGLLRQSRARQSSSESLSEPVGNHPYHVGPHHHRRRELRIVTREAVGVLHEKMVEVRQHARSDVLVSALLECGLL
jgi:hypothetical protein